MIGILFIVGAYRGYKAGFILEITSLIAIMLGVFAGFKLMDAAIALLHDRLDINESILPFVAFGIVFLLVVIGVSLLGRLLKGIIDKSLFGVFDQALGAIAGILKIIFMTSVVIWIFDSMALFPSAWTEESMLYPFLAGVAPKIAVWLSAIFPSLKDIF